MWLICGTAIGKGKNKLLIRGIEGAGWVFCPSVKSPKRDRVSISSCQGCRHFIRFEQTYIPQMNMVKNVSCFKKTAPKEFFHVARALNQPRPAHRSFAFLSHVPSLMEERQPLIDIFEEKGHLIVLAELPGVDEKSVNIKTDDDTITITAENATRKYLKIVRLPVRIKKETMKFTCKNNVLQVRFKKLCATKQNQDKDLAKSIL